MKFSEEENQKLMGEVRELQIKLIRSRRIVRKLMEVHAIAGAATEELIECRLKAAEMAEACALLASAVDPNASDEIITQAKRLAEDSAAVRDLIVLDS